jgi:hypothetical protein
MQAFSKTACLGNVAAFNVARAPQNGPKRGQLQVSGDVIKYLDAYAMKFGAMWVAPGVQGRHHRALAGSLQWEQNQP